MSSWEPKLRGGIPDLRSHAPTYPPQSREHFIRARKIGVESEDAALSPEFQRPRLARCLFPRPDPAPKPGQGLPRGSLCLPAKAQMREWSQANGQTLVMWSWLRWHGISTDEVESSRWPIEEARFGEMEEK